MKHKKAFLAREAKRAEKARLAPVSKQQASMFEAGKNMPGTEPVARMQWGKGGYLCATGKREKALMWKNPAFADVQKQANKAKAEGLAIAATLTEGPHAGKVIYLPA